MVFWRVGKGRGLPLGPGSATWGLVPLVVLVFLMAGCGNDDPHSADPAPTSTPVPSPSPARQCCPTGVSLAIDGPATDVDLGATGINYDTPFPRGISVDLAVNCGAEDGGSCGTCEIAARPDAERRCFNDASRTCTRDAECAAGRCVTLFGPPIGLTASGVPTCLMVEVTSLGPGTLEPATRETTLPIGMAWTLFQGLALDAPCPICDGGALGAPGVCHGGPRDGQACVVGGTDALLGDTSVDCPPNQGASAGTFPFALTLSTGTVTLPADDVCLGGGFVGAPCYCSGQPILNTCLGGHCEEDADGEGVCVDGPADGLCEREPYRACSSEEDCRGAGDRCVLTNRACLGAAREITGASAPLVRRGRPGTDALLVALSCVSPGNSGLVNQSLNLPSAVSVRMPVRMTTPPCPNDP